MVLWYMVFADNIVLVGENRTDINPRLNEWSFQKKKILN